MIIVHHLNNSRSQRVLWLLEELGLAYEVRRYERNPKTRLAPEALRRVHPLGKSPVLTDGDETFAETGLILISLCDRYDDGRLAPLKSLGPESEARLRWLYWLHYAEGSAMPPLLLRLIFSAMPPASPWVLRPVVRMIAGKVNAVLIGPQLELHIGYWEAALAAHGWFAGPDFSAADVMMSFPVEAAAARVGFGADRPHLRSFLDRIHARPAYARALDRGGPYGLS